MPRFVGLINKNQYTAVGDTEIQWFDGFCRPFFVGFSHRINMLVAGHRNVFISDQHLILSGIGYEFRLEIGWNYAEKIENNGLKTTQLFMTERGQKLTISLFAKMR
ncbi:MAG: hypothetical protein ACRCV0_00890 [Brevinema sp.]